MHLAPCRQRITDEAIAAGLLDQRRELILRQVGFDRQIDVAEAKRLHVLFGLDLQRQLANCDPALAGDVRDRQAHAGSDRRQQQLGWHRAAILAAVLGRLVAVQLMHAAHVDPCAISAEPLDTHAALMSHVAAPAPKAAPAIAAPGGRKTWSRATAAAAMASGGSRAGIRSAAACRSGPSSARAARWHP